MSKVYTILILSTIDYLLTKNLIQQGKVIELNPLLQDIEHDQTTFFAKTIIIFAGAMILREQKKELLTPTIILYTTIILYQIVLTTL